MPKWWWSMLRYALEHHHRRVIVGAEVGLRFDQTRQHLAVSLPQIQALLQTLPRDIAPGPQPIDGVVIEVYHKGGFMHRDTKVYVLQSVGLLIPASSHEKLQMLEQVLKKEEAFNT